MRRQESTAAGREGYRRSYAAAEPWGTGMPKGWGTAPGNAVQPKAVGTGKPAVSAAARRSSEIRSFMTCLVKG